MKRLFCLFAIIFVFSSLLNLFLGRTFGIVAVFVLTAALIASFVLRIKLKDSSFTNIIVAVLFAIYAFSSVTFIFLPKLEDAGSLDSHYVKAQGKIVSVSSAGKYTAFTVKCNELEDVKGPHNVTVMILNPSGEAEIGKRLSFSGKLEFEDSVYNKGNESFLTVFTGDYEVLQDTDLIGKLVYNLRTRIKLISNKMKHTSLVDALIIGDKSGLDAETKDDFQAIGTSHLLAISGLHLSMIVLSFYSLTVRLGVPHLYSSVLSSLLSFVYMLITGCSLSLMRAAQMMFVFFFARTVRRRKDGITSLSFAGVVIVAMSPWSLFNVGFLLSFFATLGIVVFAPTVTGGYRKYLIDKQEKGTIYTRRQLYAQRVITLLLGSVVTTLSASIMTIPIIMYFYNKISVFTVIGNLFTIFITKYFLLASFISVVFQIVGLTFFAYPFTAISNLLGSILLSLTKLLGSMAPKLISVNTAFLPVCIVLTVIIITVFFAFHKKIWSLPSLVLSLSMFIVLFNFISALMVYNVALIDSISRKGANTTLVRWQNRTYLLDQTASNSRKIYSLDDVAEYNGVTKVDCAVFLTLSQIPKDRIISFLQLFDIEKLVLVTEGPDSDDIIDVIEACRQNDVELEIANTQNYSKIPGITAYCIDEMCTAFVITNNGNTFCTYRSYTDDGFYQEAIDSDTLVFYGKKDFLVGDTASDGKFILHN